MFGAAVLFGEDVDREIDLRPDVRGESSFEIGDEHRLDFGRTDLIGIVTYSFIVDAAGRFSNIRMLASSGWPELDRVAKLAIERSSGRVKRPRLIGAEPLAVVQEVRFQYGLH